MMKTIKPVILTLLLLASLLPLFGQQTDNKRKFTDVQKQHAKIYYQIVLSHRKGQSDFDRDFKAFYTPIVDDCERLFKEHKKFEAFFKEKANASLESNKQEIAKKQEKARICFGQLADLTQTITEAFKNKESSKIDKSLAEYKQIEKTLQELGAKFPQRNWVTVSEAELLVAQAMRNNQTRKPVKN